MAHPKPFRIRTPLPSILETAKRLGVSHSDVLKIENLVDEAMNEKKIAIVGFGTFATGKRKARTGRNPQAGKAIKIGAKKVARFSAAVPHRKPKVAASSRISSRKISVSRKK